MTHDKLRAWLKLPDGPWPPDFYTLIALAPGAGTPDEIEARVLERLELLRRYQLPHPDEATEGMNLLARALDTLTDPDARRDYDKSLGLKPATKVPELPRRTASDDLNVLFPGVPLLPAASEGPAAAAEDESALPDVMVLEPADEEPDIDDEPEFLDEDAPALPDAVFLPVPPPVARLEEKEADRPRRPKSPRRELYADLARVRKVLRVFERARPYLTDADRTFSRRADTLAVMGCLAELRPLLPTVADVVGTGRRPGREVAALARQRLLFDTFRSLHPDDRDALSRDFRAAHYALAGFYNDLRDEVRRRTEKDWFRSAGRPFLRYLGEHPEWLILPFAAAVLVVAAVRSV